MEYKNDKKQVNIEKSHECSFRIGGILFQSNYKYKHVYMDAEQTHATDDSSICVTVKWRLYSKINVNEKKGKKTTK